MSTPPWLAALNDEQRAAAQAATGPVCILAGAGTGKTRTITHRIAHQVHSGVAEPSQILAVTFTDKAAAELRQRLQALGLPAPIRAATFHAAAWAQLRWFWPRCNDGPLPEVLPSKVRLLVPLARRTNTEAKDLAAEIEWAKARRLSAAEYEAAAADRDAPLSPPRMAAVYEEYERAKTAQSLIDYDDMLLHTLALLETQPEMAAEVRDRYRHFTVDEFQDVNPAQFGLLRAWLGDRDSVCVVGDDDQTIYSFTGATSQYLREFRTHFPGTTQVTLTRNYRSTPQVLALANKVLWTKPAATRKHLASDGPAGPVPAFVEHDDDEAELAAVVAGIQGLLGQGTPPGEIAVLYRVNSQSEPLEAALGKAGIPFVMAGGGGFYDHDEVRGAMRVLAAAAIQPDAAPLGLEDTTAADPPGLADRVRRTLRQQMGWNATAEPRGEAARERWRNLGMLVELAVREEEATPDLTLGEFVQRLQARAAAGADAAGDAGAVTLSTLHRAKGREFDAVFLIAAEEGLLPISHAKTDEAVEEERRLLYVGVTRARRHLTISWAQRRPGWGGKVVARRPSRFLYNLGEGAPVKGSAAPAKASAKRGGALARECDCGRPLVASADRKRGRCWSCFSGGASPEIAQRLRTWRSQRAAADDVPAFVVFNDTTLAELARVQPRTRRALLSVTGIGPAKVERYGDALLEVLDTE